jgi:hypothetical protein
VQAKATAKYTGPSTALKRGFSTALESKLHSVYRGRRGEQATTNAKALQVEKVITVLVDWDVSGFFDFAALRSE